MVIVSFNTANGKRYYNVMVNSYLLLYYSFNTVNGKYCCNKLQYDPDRYEFVVFQYRKR